jgi:hypothetical protein
MRREMREGGRVFFHEMTGCEMMQAGRGSNEEGSDERVMR